MITQEPLTAREKDVMYWITEGKTNNEVADLLFIESATVETHLRNVRSKLAAANTLHAAVLIERHDMLKNHGNP